MADYFSPTVIQPTIPIADMTPLERLILSHVFSAEQDGDELYLYADEGTSSIISVDRAELEEALAASQATPSELNDYVAKGLASCPAGEQYIDLDLDASNGDISWEFILQDIVRRSRTLRYVTAVTSFTCSKMRADGFGGMAVLITADKIMGKSTADIIEDFLDDEGLAGVQNPSAKAADAEEFEALMPDGSRVPWDERLRTAGALMVPKEKD